MQCGTTMQRTKRAEKRLQIQRLR